MKDASRDLFMALNYLVVNNSSSAKGRVVLLTSLHNIGYKITAFNYIGKDFTPKKYQSMFHSRWKALKMLKSAKKLTPERE